MSNITIPYRIQIPSSNEELISELTKALLEENLLNIVIFTSKTPTYLLTNILETSLFNKVKSIKTFQVVDASMAYINQLSIGKPDVIIGVGGGKVIDVAKHFAHLLKVPSISIPTVISNDGVASPYAVLKDKGKYSLFESTIPYSVFAPIHLIQKSSPEYLIAGIGDLLGNISALEDWILASKESNEKIDDYAYLLSEMSVNQVLYAIKNYIIQGKTKSEFLNDNLRTIINSLILSGISMEVAKSTSPSVGSESMIAESISGFANSKKQHGFYVAFGLYLITYLKYKNGFSTKKDFEEIKTILTYLGLPITLEPVGITLNDLTEAVSNSLKAIPSRYTYLNKINLSKNNLYSVFQELFSSSKSRIVL